MDTWVPRVQIANPMLHLLFIIIYLHSPISFHEEDTSEKLKEGKQVGRKKRDRGRCVQLKLDCLLHMLQLSFATRECEQRCGQPVDHIYEQ